MYDGGIGMAARVFVGSYVRANYPGTLPLLPQYESSQKWCKAHGQAELSVPFLPKAVPVSLPEGGLPT